MSDETIRVGDVVYAWRGHECCLGITFVVSEIRATTKLMQCGKCFARDIPVSGTGAVGRARRVEFPLEWLKKLPPLTEDKTQDMELTA